MLKKLNIYVAIAAVLMLSACGTNQKDRTTGGAAAGGATGAAIGAFGGPPGMFLGGVIGAGIGATSGAVIDEKNLNLGEPVWKKKQ